MEYRLGLDIGTNSIGWCMLRLNNGQPVSVIKAGSRIFSDGREPKSRESLPGKSLAVKRREARSMRRNLKRRGQRTALLMKDLIKYGLLPENEGERKALALLDPYELRAKAIREEIPTYSLGRVLMHLSKRRGFKSNRIAERKSKENGKIKPAIERFQKEMKEKGCETAGEYFYYLIKEGKTVRIRLGSIKGEKGEKEGYERYLDRSMVWEEFNKIMTRQKAYRKELTEGVIERLARDIFYQRPLKPVDPGKCSIFPDEKRIAKAYPAAQDFIMLQKINDLRVNIKDEFVPQPPLTNEEKNVLKEELRKKRKMTFNEIRKTFAKKGFSADYGEFSHESTEKDLPGNVTNAVMASKELFGEKWYKLTEEERKEIIRRLLSVQDDDTAISEYLIKNYGLTEQEAENVLDKGFSSLPEGYLKYSEKALSLLLPFMDDQNMDLTSAKIEAGISETSDNIMADGSYDFLPYYGIPLESHVAFSTGEEDDPEEKRYGKIANPTVHIALNQLRKLINEIIELYGKPAEIVVELARDLKNSMEEKKRITKKNQENRKENEKFTEELNSYGQQTTKDNMLKMKLWHEIDRVCVYSGKKISCRELFTDEVQIEHILPFSRTLDDGYANKILSMREANYYKANRTPYEAFGKSEDGYDYNEIVDRAGKLPENKRWRFNKDAMKRYEKERDFLSRQLNDTRYISKIAKEYLELIFPKEERKSKVRAIPGTLTGLIRGKLGLNSVLSENKNKNRNDHRHHAVDAFVVAVTTRSLLQKVATAAENPQRRNRLIENMPVPYEGYFKDVENAMETIKVSHKQDRGLTGRLHEDTSYGLVKNGDKEIGNLVRRKPAKSLTDKEYLSIRDSEIRKIINGVNIKDEEERKIMTEEIDSFIASNKIRSLRLLEKKDIIITMTNKQGEVYKAFIGGNNLCVEIYRLPDGTKKYEVIQLFDANQKDFRPKWINEEPEAKLLYRLFKGDVVRYKENDKYAYVTVEQIWKDDAVLLPLHEAGQIKKRQKAENKKIYVYKSYSLLFNDLQAQPVNISVTGLVKKAKYADPFFWEKR